MQKMVFMLLAVAASLQVAAQKTVYIPDEWRNPWPSDSLLYKESDPDNKYTWSKSRSVESDNVIVFWDKGYGSTLPSKSASAYRVDEHDLLKKCEAFYDLEINKLGFVDPAKSNLSKYKVMVLLNHTTSWVCYGGGYDYQVSALWLGPSACKPVGHSVAHEVGHSFHYMCYAEHSRHQDSQTDNTGFHLECGKGQAIWEQTAQWQAAQSYPELMFDQSIAVFRKSHNYAFSHEWHRYQSYWFHYYLCQYYNDPTTVAQVWNQPMPGQTRGQATDFNQALMKLKGLSATDLYRLYYDYAARCATWDFDACAPYRDPYIGDFEYRCVPVGDKSYQVALASTPQSTGFNVIPLQVPRPGTPVTVHFTALKAGDALAGSDPAEMMGGETSWTTTNRTTYIKASNYVYRAFRLGYVALMHDGTRRYFHADSLYCTGFTEKTADVAMTVPEGVARLWFIVSPAPKTYVQHLWKDEAENAEHWPYRFSLEGTDLGSSAVVYEEPILDGRPVSDVTLTYDVCFPATTNGSYLGTTVTFSGRALATLGTALQMKPDAIAGLMQAYSVGGPSAGHIMCYPCDPKTGALVNRGATANGYGHWFNASGHVSDYASGYLYSEPDFSALTFAIGPYPDKARNGQTFTVTQALRYRKSSTEEATARFVFNVRLQAGAASVQLSDIAYHAPATTVERTYASRRSPATVFDLLGHPAGPSARHSICIVNGKKVIR